VAFIERDGQEIVVGAGATPTEALQQAKEKGFNNVVLFSVPSFSEAQIY